MILNGTRLFGPFLRKISGSYGTFYKVVLFFRTESSNGSISSSHLISLIPVLDLTGHCFGTLHVNSLRSRRLEVVGTRKNGRARRRHPSRVSLAHARSPFCPLLPSACYAGYHVNRTDLCKSGGHLLLTGACAFPVFSKSLRKFTRLNFPLLF